MKKKFFTLLVAAIGSMPSWATQNALSLTSDAVTEPSEEEVGMDLITDYVFPEWNECDITLTGKNCKYYGFDDAMEFNGDGILKATIEVETDAILYYTCSSGSSDNTSFTIKIDDGEEQIIEARSPSNLYVEIPSGKHTITWHGGASTPYTLYQLTNIGVRKTGNLISVELLEPGSMGTEILYHVNHINQVKQLKVKGQMNDDDLAVLSLMKDNLFMLDLSEAYAENIPDYCFKEAPFLHTVMLPNGVKRIGTEAFYKSSVYNITFPNTLQTIGDRAFYESNITSALLHDNCNSIGAYCFYNCYLLETVQLSDPLKVIPEYAFAYCSNLKSFDLPTSLETIAEHAFYSCNNAYFDFPVSLKSIGSYAFCRTNLKGEKKELILHDNVTEIGQSAFAESGGYDYVELPISYFGSESWWGSEGANIKFPASVKTIRINTATVLKLTDSYNLGAHIQIVPDEACANVTLQVPQHLVNAYKLDTYWYKFKAVEGFSTEEIDEWIIDKDLVLDARSRLLGTPSITINGEASLKINGEDGMTINNLYVYNTPRNDVWVEDHSENIARSSRFISNAEGVTVEGELVTLFTLSNGGYPDYNRWYYISLPYDIKAGDISSESGQCAVRYYDGASRATNGATGNWKNYKATDIIPAGTGFIIQVSHQEDGLWRFPAQNNASKQYMTSNKVFVKELAENASDNASDRGWNLIGNPYQSWYNIHKLNFTAPITVRELSNNTYSAYSIIDDDYALAPNQAFFVQRPSEVTSISFPLDGRQLTSEITDQNNAPSVNPQAPGRLLTDIVVSNGTDTDRTRVVLNEKATTLYDMGSDANKFMAENANVPQIYTIDDNGTQYAINERPVADGVVRLGFRSNGGSFVFSLARNMSEKVVLIDNVTGQETDLTQQDYSFSADAATCDNRFEVRFFGGATGVDNLSGEKANVTITDNGISITNASGLVEVFNVNGMKVAAVSGNGNVQLSAGVYVVKTAGLVKKVVVK